MTDALLHHPVAQLAALPEGRMLACTVDGRALVVCRTREGVFAVDDFCTHAFARMSEGRLRGMRLICTLHGAGFGVRDGRVLAGPATQPLATHFARVVGDRVEVALDPAAPPQPEPF